MKAWYVFLFHSIFVFSVIAQFASAADPGSASGAAKKIKAIGTIEPPTLLT